MTAMNFGALLLFVPTRLKVLFSFWKVVFFSTETKIRLKIDCEYLYAEKSISSWATLKFCASNSSFYRFENTLCSCLQRIPVLRVRDRRGTVREFRRLIR